MTNLQNEHDFVLEQTRRYRVMIPSALATTCDRHMSAPAASRVLQSLVEKGLLGKAPLYRRREYFHLAEEGARRIAELGSNPHGDEMVDHGALSEIAKIRAFAFLSYCCMGNTRRERLTFTDMHSRYPNLLKPGQPQRYYADLSSPKPVLGFLHVDAGGPGRWDRIIRAFRGDMIEHVHRPEFRQLIQEDQFEMAIVTALPQKAERIRAALNDPKAPLQVRIRIAAIPDLLHLIAPPPY